MDTGELDLETVRQKLAAIDARTVRSDAQAAVAAILRWSETGPEVLFIRRAEHPNDPWSGHMAFPGGRLDAADRSLEHTAIRETREELGMHLPEHGELIGRLDDVPTHKTGLVVRPFVWTVQNVPRLALNHEVDAVHWVDLRSLASGERDTTYELVWNGRPHRLPGYRVADQVVWGLTHRMMQILFEVLER